MSALARILGISILAAYGVMAPISAHAAACDSAGSGNWDAAGTWSAPCNVPGGPTAADTVTIGAAHTVTLTGPATAASIVITGATASNGLDLAGNTLTVGGSISVGAPSTNGQTTTLNVGSGTLNAESLAIAGGAGTRIGTVVVSTGTLNITGSVTFSGTAGNARFVSSGASTVNLGGNFANGGTLTTGATGTFNFNGAGNQTIGAYTTYNNVTIAKSGGTATLGGTVTVGGTLNIVSGTLDVANTLTVTGPTTISGALIHSSSTGTKSFTGDVTVNAGGSWSETAAETVTFSGSLTNNGAFSASTGQHNLSGSGKDLSGTLTIPFVNLTGSYTNNNSLTVSTLFSGAGTLTNAANATLTVSATSVAPTLVTDASGSSVTYNRAGNQTVKGTAYYRLNLAGSGTKTLNTAASVATDLTTSGTVSCNATANLTVSGNVTVASGTTLSFGAGDKSVAGTTTVSGTLRHTSTTGTKTYTGDVIVNSGATWSESAAATVVIWGNIQNSGTVTGSTGTHTLAGTGKTLSGTIAFPSTTVSGSYTNNGTFTVSTTLAGSGSLTNGTSATLNIGAATMTLATLDVTASGNTVNFSRSGAQTVPVLPYYNLGISGSNTKTPAGDLTITNNFTINSGTFAGGTGRTHTIGGNFTRTGTLSVGTSTFVFNGGADQTLTAGGTTLTFYRLKIDKSGGTATLGKNTTVTNLLTLERGTVTTGSNILIAPTTSCALTTTITRTSGYVVGNLRMTFPNTVGLTCSFPIGDSIGYAPVTLTKTNNRSGTLTARVDSGNHPDGTDLSGIDQTKNANHYWSLTAGTLNAATAYSAVFQFCATPGACSATEVDADATTSNFIVAKRVNGAWSQPVVGTKTAYSTQATGLTGFGSPAGTAVVFAVGEPKPSSLFDHIGIFHSVTSCLGDASVTLKACTNAACTTTYSGTVTGDLSVTGNAAWPNGAATSSFSFSGGQTSLTLTDNTAQTVTLSATVTSPTVAAGAQCYDTSGALAGCALTFGACGFDVVEVGAAAGTPINTKLADAAFNLDVVSTSGVSATVDSVEIVNAATGGNCNTFASLGTSPTGGSLFAANQRKTYAFSYADAARNARIRVNFGSGQTACSTDSFAIRPKYFEVSSNANNGKTDGTPVFAAGSDQVTLTATAKSATNSTTVGYNGTPALNMNNFVVTGGQKPGTLILVSASASATNGVSSAAAIYTEVGNFNMTKDAVFDDTFTSVDGTRDCIAESSYPGDEDSYLDGGKIGCRIGSKPLDGIGRFRPAFFQTVAVAACDRTAPATAFTYSGQPFNNVRITACAGTTACTVTANYNEETGFGRTVTLSDPTVTGDALKNNIIPASAFVDGVASLSNVAYRFPAAETPQRNVTLRAADGEASSAGHTEATPLLRQGRLKLDNAFGSELLALPVKMTAQFYQDGAVGWRTNADDTCTTTATLTRVSGGSSSACFGSGCAAGSTDAVGSLLLADVNNSGLPGRTSPGIGPVVLQGGVANIVLSRPRARGQATMTYIAPAWLQYLGGGKAYDGAGNPRASLTFGIYKGNERTIHLREQY